MEENKQKRTAWNKGRKQTIKKLNYTNGIKNIKVAEGENPPEGFYRGQVRHMSEEEFNKNKKIQVQKTIETKIAKYGSTSYNNIEKRKQTCLQKYGSEQYTASEDFKNKSEQTCLEKYGVKNPMQSKEMQKIYREKIKEKFGVENVSQLDSSKEKVKDTWKNKSEEEMTEINKKRSATMFEKYGVDWYTESEDCKEKIKQTCLEKYGVEYSCLRKECRQHSNDSKPNKYFEQLLIDNNINYEREFVLDRKAFDFKVDNILIEINPSITHNSTFQIFNKKPLDSKYHYEKSQIALKNNYRCIHVYDWDDLNKIINMLKSRKVIGARKCKCKEIDLASANIFINNYHLQGAIKADRAFGLFYGEEIVSVMTFGKPRYNKNFEWELIRYVSKDNITGGVEKLFKFSVKELEANSVISYCDYNKFTGNTYLKLNFKYIRTSICKHWYNIKTKKHITDNLLRKNGFDRLLGKEYGCFGKGSSNEELMKKFNFVEIYDAGQGTYTWKKS